MKKKIDFQATAKTQARYERLAPLYDAMEIFPERRYAPWRSRLWSLIQGPAVLEVGVGTGKNIAYYPPGVEITGIDLTPGMLEHARRRSDTLNKDVRLRLGDVQALDFSDNAFDEAVATFVFCSVPDPALGLHELMRVVKPGGRLYLLEHMRAANEIVGAIMDIINPLTVRLTGANINRRTVKNVRQSGWRLDRIENLGLKGVFKMLVAAKNK